MAFPTPVIAGPVEVYVAPTGTAFPKVDAAPAVAWVLLGTQGALDYDDSGVSITNSVDTEDFVPLGAIEAVKSWLTGSDVRVSFQLANISLEMLSHAYGGPATAAGNVTTTAAGAGTAGYKSLSLTRSGIPQQVAMLIRSEQSPYDDANAGFNMQWELNRVAQVAEVPLEFMKGTPVKVQFEYRVYRDENGVGQILAQHAAAI